MMMMMMMMMMIPPPPLPLPRVSATDVVRKSMNTSLELHNLKRRFCGSFQRAAVVATIK